MKNQDPRGNFKWAFLKPVLPLYNKSVVQSLQMGSKTALRISERTSGTRPAENSAQVTALQKWSKLFHSSKFWTVVRNGAIRRPQSASGVQSFTGMEAQKYYGWILLYNKSVYIYIPHFCRVEE